MVLQFGRVPFWMVFWGFGLLSHALRVAPAFSRLLGKREPAEDIEREPDRSVVRSSTSVLGETASRRRIESLLPSDFLDEVAKIRELLRQRTSTDDGSGELLQEVERIVQTMGAVAIPQRALAEQTSDAILEDLEQSEADATRRLSAASTSQDRRLIEQQLDAIRGRRRSVDGALRVLERLRVRQDSTVHQMKQLRLDLTRAKATSLPIPELSSRIHDIRYQVDAIEEVDEALASVSQPESAESTTDLT